MTQHTPEPWHISKRRDGRDMLVYGSDDFEIARVCYPNRDANARLIAAAPELLEALRGMMDAYMDLCDESEPNYKSYEFRRERWDSARAAIAKVEGAK